MANHDRDQYETSVWCHSIKNKSNIRWKCSKVTCTVKVRYYKLLWTYINGKNDTPRFPLQIWNVRHQTIINNSYRINNFSERWNSSFNKLFGSANPSFWSASRSLQLYEYASFKQKHKKKTEVHKVEFTKPVYSTKIK